MDFLQVVAAILPRIKWDASGLVPVVVQDAATQAVLMLAYSSEETLKLTAETGQAHYWSRSRAEIWRKGATSGNTQTITHMALDCDGDTLLWQVTQTGPACHRGTATCFD